MLLGGLGETLPAGRYSFWAGLWCGLTSWIAGFFGVFASGYKTHRNLSVNLSLSVLSTVTSVFLIVLSIIPIGFTSYHDLKLFSTFNVTPEVTNNMSNITYIYHVKQEHADIGLYPILLIVAVLLQVSSICGIVINVWEIRHVSNITIVDSRFGIYSIFPAKWILSLGVWMMCMGVGCIVLYGIGSWPGAHNLWGGLLFIIFGSLGVPAGIRKTRETTVFFLAACACCVITSLLVLILAVITIVYDSRGNWELRERQDNSTGHWELREQQDNSTFHWNLVEQQDKSTGDSVKQDNSKGHRGQQDNSTGHRGQQDSSTGSWLQQDDSTGHWVQQDQERGHKVFNYTFRVELSAIILCLLNILFGIIGFVILLSVLRKSTLSPRNNTATHEEG